MKILDEVGFNKLAEWLKKLKSKIDDIYNWMSLSKLENIFYTTEMAHFYIYGLTNSKESLMIPIADKINTIFIEGVNYPVSGKLLVQQDAIVVSDERSQNFFIDKYAFIEYKNIKWFVVPVDSNQPVWIKPVAATNDYNIPSAQDTNYSIILGNEENIVDIADKYSNGMYESLSINKV